MELPKRHMATPSPILILTDNILCYMRSSLLFNNCTPWRWLTVCRNISNTNCNNTLNSFAQLKFFANTSF